MHAVADSLLIVGTAANCFLFNHHRHTFDILPIPQILENDFVNCIERVHQYLSLIGTNASGLHLLDTHKKNITASNTLKPLQHAQINTLYRYENGHFLIGSDQGLYTVDSQLKNLVRKNQSTIRSIHRWDKNNLLIGGKNENFFLTKDIIRPDIIFLNHNGKELSSDVLAYQEDIQGGK